jgi:hypothetical protein
MRVGEHRCSCARFWVKMLRINVPAQRQTFAYLPVFMDPCEETSVHRIGRSVARRYVPCSFEGGSDD